MEVKQNGKELYHIQNLNMGSDGYPFDTYVWCDHFPDKTDLKKAFEIEWGEIYAENNKETLNEWLTSSEVYKVYAEEL